ncbi:hypothetical protein AA0118_g6303 [Alternaria tenuissima]|nr:hypothetical protein AA0118_g6303 [Alternaria tenuissima]
MANLSNLPSELFQMVIHELVITSKSPSDSSHPSPRPRIGQLWRLRGVCRSFAAEIEREVFSQQPREFYRHRNVRRLVRAHFSRFMLQVSRKPGSVNEKMFTRLQRMVQYIAKQVEYEDKEQRNEVMDKTYNGLSKILPMDDVIHALWCDNVGCPYCLNFLGSKLPKRLPYHDRFCAALAAGNHRLLCQILPKLAGSRIDQLITTQPIWFAIQMRDLTSLNTILRYLEAQPPSAQIYLTRTYARFSISKCISNTLWEKYLPAAQLLLDYYEKNLPCPSSKTYSGWVAEASANCSLDQLQALRAVLRFNTGSTNLIEHDTLAAVYAKGNSAAIQEVLQHVGDINKGTVRTAPIFIAVRSGRPIAIQACLQAGADVNLSMRPNMRAIGRTHMTPLETAVHRHEVSIVRILIEVGATIPHISKWPTHARTYRLLHEAASKLTDVVLPDLEHFKRCNKNDLKALKY